MLHVGLNLSRRRLDYCLLGGEGERIEAGAVAPNADALAGWSGSSSCVTARVR
jgi:transposase